MQTETNLIFCFFYKSKLLSLTKTIFYIILIEKK